MVGNPTWVRSDHLDHHNLIICRLEVTGTSFWGSNIPQQVISATYEFRVIVEFLAKETKVVLVTSPAQRLASSTLAPKPPPHRFHQVFLSKSNSHHNPRRPPPPPDTMDLKSHSREKSPNSALHNSIRSYRIIYQKNNIVEMFLTCNHRQVTEAIVDYCEPPDEVANGW